MPFFNKVRLCSLLAVLPVLALGCGGKSNPTPAPEQLRLKEIHEMYQHFVRSQKKAPGRLSDLAKRQYEGNYPATVQALQEGKYLVVWGVNSKDAGTVLAYEKDVPTRGGAVLTADGTVREMTAEEFRAAKKS